MKYVLWFIVICLAIAYWYITIPLAVILYFWKKRKNNKTKSIKPVMTSEKLNTSSILSGLKDKTENISLNLSPSSNYYNADSLINPKYIDLKTPDYILIQLSENQRNNRSMYGSYNDFVTDSVKYKNQYKNMATFYPLSTYYPAFASLNTQQLNWYLYWRKEFLNNRFLQTDLSYIFLFIYELINYSFNSSASFNISVLEKLYETYKTAFPQLDNYLPRWTKDMLVETGYYDNKELNVVKDSLIDRLEELENIDKITLREWRIFFDETRAFTNKEKVNLYRMGQQKYNSKFRKVMTNLVLYYHDNDINIVDKWFELKVFEERNHPFAGAIGNIYNRGTGITKYKKYVPTEEANSIVGSISRLCFDMIMFPPNLIEKDYIMDKISKESYNLPNEFIESLYSTKTPKVKVDKVKAVEKDEEPIKERDALENTAKFVMPDERVIPIFGILAPDFIDEAESVVTQEGEGFNIDLEAIKELDNTIEIVSAKSKIEYFSEDKDFIELFEDGKVPKGTAKSYCIKRGKMINAFINEVNSKYGFELIIEDDENYILNDGGK